MSRSLKHVNSKSITRIYKIFHQIIQRLPSTFPSAHLVVHTNLMELRKYYTDTMGDEPEEDLPYVFCDGDTYTVHVHLTMNNESIQEVAWFFLHELGHLYAHNRYGCYDKRWSDYNVSEEFANRFANRWLKKLNEEDQLRL